MDISRDAEARENLVQIKKFLDNVPQKKPPKVPQQGFFRAAPYLWTAFIYTYDKDDREYKLIIHENIQHEGYAKKKLGIETEEDI